MKVRSGPNVRIMTQVVSHYQHSVRQHAGDMGTTPAFGVQHVAPLRAVNEVRVCTHDRVRMSKVLKNGVRRVTYKGW